MKLVYYGYRDWAFEVFRGVKAKEKYLVTTQDYDIVDSIKPDLVFFVGWSYKIPENIVNDYTCVCLHPSPLPKYRGGSPIQNQILRNEKDSSVSLFIMDEGLDTGDVLYQSEFSLSGSLDDIFDRIVTIGIRGINYITNNANNLNNIKTKQDDSVATFFRRKKQSDSEIKISDFEKYEPEYFYNKIRCLNNPYPNAFIRCKNGEKLFILSTRIES